jgi:hypothetical protein
MHNLELNCQRIGQSSELNFSLASVDANLIYKKLAKSLHPALNSTTIQGPPVYWLRIWFNGAHNVCTQTMQTNTISNMCICVSNTYKDSNRAVATTEAEGCREQDLIGIPPISARREMRGRRGL